MPSSPHPEARLRGRRCLVTGASGFLGGRLVPRLIDAGMRVTAQVRSPGVAPAGAALVGADVRLGDMTDPGWGEATRRDWRWDDVVHLAGPVSGGVGSMADEARVARAHAQIALALSGAIPPGWGGRLIHASSMTVYGAAPTLPVKETQPLAPAFLYALGKVLAEDVWNASGVSDMWMLRLPGLFALERRSGALYHFIKAALEGRPIILSAREPTLWDILHVDDAVEAIVRALESPEPFHGAVNVSYGEVVNLGRIAERIAQLTTQVRVVNATHVQHPDFQLDIAYAKARLGWPPRSLDSRLEELIAGMRRDQI
jgi:nucleoside-diphosphate-sugar epimerase